MKPVRQLEISEENGWARVPGGSGQFNVIAFQRKELDGSTLVVCFCKGSIGLTVHPPGRRSSEWRHHDITGLLESDGRIWVPDAATMCNLAQRVRPWRDAALTMNALRCL